MVLLLLTILVYGVSIDCPNVVIFAKHMNMDIQQPVIWSQLNSDCCTTTVSKVKCDGNQRVIDINWNTKNLNGSIEWTNLPPNLQNLNLNKNTLTGVLPELLPESLVSFNIGHNNVNGTLPITIPSKLIKLAVDDNFIRGSYNGIWPPGLQELWLNDNLMSGYIPLDTLPSTLKTLNIGHLVTKFNSFTGQVYLYQPVQVNIDYNYITDLQIVDTSKLTVCDISNTPLLNNPHISALTMCFKANLYLPATSVLLKSDIVTHLSKDLTITSASTFTILTSEIIGTASLASFNLTYWLTAVFKAIVLTFICSAVLFKTPFKREFKRMFLANRTND